MESGEDVSKLNKLQDGISPEAWSTNSDSPTPRNSAIERPWAKDVLWQGLLGDEHRLLLGTEEESSDKHSSDDDLDTDIESLYRISSEQLEYYKKQFSIIQPDAKGLVSGHIAKIFFEKSGIPIEELRHIWQLCDVTKDGALCLSEFVAAMHLVVLRRNNIPLPNVLPSCLNPINLIQQEDVGVEAVQDADLLNLNDTSDSKINESINSNELIHSIGADYICSQFNESSSPADEETVKTHSIASSPLPAEGKSTSGKDLNKDWTNPNRQWTKFPESPISNVSSPGLKPANFDMQRTAQAVVSDPQILHPVPLRVTPVETGNIQQNVMKQNEVSKGNNLLSANLNTLHGTEFCIQRPVSKKVAKKSTGLIPQPPQRDAVVAAAVVAADNAINVSNKLEQPPLPPPRPYRHARSSSLDLNKLKMNNAENSEVVKQEISNADTYGIQELPNFGFADFAQFGTKEKDSQKRTTNQHEVRPSKLLPTSFQSSARISAFEVYRKPLTQFLESEECKSPSTILKINSGIYGDMIRNVSLVNGKNVTEILRNLKKHNALLLDICKNLSEELLLIQQYKQEFRNNICVGKTAGQNL